MNPRPRPKVHRDARRRGSVLVLVLGVTSIVGVIGLSSLLAVRLQHRDVQSRADAAQAQQLADGVLQLLHARLSDDEDWRTAHTHDTWTADESLGLGSTLRYKLQDEDDADLADDNSDHARLVVRVAHGNAVRLASIQLGGGGVMLGPELVTNGDMETGSNGYGISVVFGNVTTSGDNPYAGTASLHLTGRSSQLVAMKQDLASGSIASGKTYRVAAWVKLKDSAVDVKLGLLNSRGLAIDAEEDRSPGSTDWTYHQFDLTPQFTITPTTTYVYGVTATGKQNMAFDNLSVREVLSADLPLIRGSYRRELDP